MLYRHNDHASIVGKHNNTTGIQTMLEIKIVTCSK